MEDMKVRPGRQLQRKFQRPSGIIGEVNCGQHSAVWSLRRLFHNQHWTVPFAHDFFSGCTEKQILHEISAMRAYNSQVRRFLSGATDDLHKRLASHDADSH
jgi:hypothetical protein